MFKNIIFFSSLLLLVACAEVEKQPDLSGEIVPVIKFDSFQAEGENVYFIVEFKLISNLSKKLQFDESRYPWIHGSGFDLIALYPSESPEQKEFELASSVFPAHGVPVSDWKEVKANTNITGKICLNDYAKVNSSDLEKYYFVWTYQLNDYSLKGVVKVHEDKIAMLELVSLREAANGSYSIKLSNEPTMLVKSSSGKQERFLRELLKLVHLNNSSETNNP